GRYTEEQTRRRWRSLRLLSTHFLDVVRGLPTLRAFDRGEAEATRIEAASEEYRRATMATLRVSFLSGSVLELAATLGVALAAVTVGVRLADGGVGPPAGGPPALPAAPPVPPPPPPRGPVPPPAPPPPRPPPPLP